MKKHEKAQVVHSLHEAMQKSDASFVVTFKGLSVKSMQRLRKEVRESGGSLKVAKARLMKRAATDLEGADHLMPYFKNQVGLVFASKNFPEVAKVLHSFSKKNELFQFVAGFLEKKVFDKQSVIRIAQLPNKEVLIAQLCCVLQGPARNFASLFHVMIARLLFVLQRIAEKEKA